jgi:hypothetical protein
MKGIGVPWVNQPAPTPRIMKNFGHYIITCNLSESWLIDLTTIYRLPLAPLILVLLKSPSCRFSWIHNAHKKASVNALHPVNRRQSLRSRVEGICLPFWNKWGDLTVRITLCACLREFMCKISLGKGGKLHTWCKLSSV